MYNYLDEPNGSMKGGDPGVRLIEQAVEGKTLYIPVIKGTTEHVADELSFVPVFEIFGSEELSSAGSAISQRIKGPFVFINQKYAENNGIAENETIRLKLSGLEINIKVKIENSLPAGIAGLSVNLPGMPFVDLPASGKVFKL
jgi:NADH-quinone oxidoreductase subunit G